MSELILPERPKMPTWRSEPVRYAQGKLDGIMLRVVRPSDGSGIRCFTRHPDPTKGDVTEKVKDARWFSIVWDALAPGESLMGELWRDGRRASDVKSDWREAWFTCFAVPSLTPRERLENVDVWLGARGIDFVPYRLADRLGGWDLHDPRAVDPNFEGFVMKRTNMEGWFKLKPERTVDLIVSRLKPGNGAYLGMVGALIMKTFEGHEVGNASGMDYGTRRLITWRDVGRVAEIEYQYVGNRGRLRHPRFVRWREDKRPEDCTADQDPELEAYWIK